MGLNLKACSECGVAIRKTRNSYDKSRFDWINQRNIYLKRFNRKDNSRGFIESAVDDSHAAQTHSKLSADKCACYSKQNKKKLFEIQPNEKRTLCVSIECGRKSNVSTASNSGYAFSYGNQLASSF